MNAAKSTSEASITEFLASRIEAGDFPSAVYLIAENGRAIFADALGNAVREPESHPASLDTIYDLASLTKPLITGLLCAQLVERGELGLDNPVADYLPEFDRADKGSITIRRLLTHTSGLSRPAADLLMRLIKSFITKNLTSQPSSVSSLPPGNTLRPRRNPATLLISLFTN